MGLGLGLGLGFGFELGLGFVRVARAVAVREVSQHDEATIAGEGEPVGYGAG